MITIDAQIFLGTIFRGLNFRGDKFLRVVVAHKNFNPHEKLFTGSTREAQFFMGLIFVGNARPWKLNSHKISASTVIQKT